MKSLIRHIAIGIAAGLVAAFALPAAAQNCSGQPAANQVCAGPASGGGGLPSFRALVPADIPATPPSGAAGGDLGGTYPNPVLAAGWSNTRLAKTANYAAVTGDCTKTLALGGTAFFTLTINAASGYDSRCTFVVVNEDTGRGKLLAINGLSNFILWPGQTATIYNDANVWRVDKPNRWKLAGNVTFNVNGASGVDANNDCLGTGAGACATIANALTLVCSSLDASGLFQINISVAAGTYAGFQLCIVVGGPQGAGVGGPDPTITGDTTTPSNVIIDGVAGTAIRAGGPSLEWLVQGLTLTTSGAGVPLIVDASAWLRLGVMRWGANGSGVAMQAINRGVIEFMGNQTIAMGAGIAFAFSTGQSQILNAGANTFTLSGSPTFSGGFALCSSNSLQVWDSAVFSGAVGGGASPRYATQLGCGISTAAGGATFLPGNAVGTAINPGWYN